MPRRSAPRNDTAETEDGGSPSSGPAGHLPPKGEGFIRGETQRLGVKGALAAARGQLAGNSGQNETAPEGGGKMSRVNRDGSLRTLEERVQGDELLDAQDLIEEVRSVGGEVDENGYIILYHRTSAESAANIRKTGYLIGKEDGLFFSTNENGYNEGYGDTAVKFSVPAEMLTLDDIFSNEAHLRIPMDKPGKMYLGHLLDMDERTTDTARRGNANRWQLDVEDSFGVRKINDFIGVQRRVVGTLTTEGFFENGHNVVTNAATGMTIEITKSGIEHTLGYEKLFSTQPRIVKDITLAVIRELPKIIREADAGAIEVGNVHGRAPKFTYLYHKMDFAPVGPIEVKVDIRHAAQKNVFWVHSVTIENENQALTSAGERTIDTAKKLAPDSRAGMVSQGAQKNNPQNADGKASRVLPEAWRRNAERMAAEEQTAENAQPAAISGEEAQTWADMKKFKKVKEGRPGFPPNKDTRIYLPAATDLMTLTSRPL